MKIRFLPLVVLLCACVAARATTPCESNGNIQTWKNDCDTPTIIVEELSNGIVDVVFVGNSVYITTTNDGDDGSSIRLSASVPLGEVEIGGANAIDVLLSLDLDESVDLIRIAEVSSIRNLSVGGEVRGNLGGLIATGVNAVESQNFTPFRVAGNLTGNLQLLDRAGAYSLRLLRMVIEGGVAAGVIIDTDSGGIGTIEVGGVIGSDSGPVLIRSGLDITSITAGAMYVNIEAFRNDPNDDPDMGNIYANIHELRTDKLAGNGGLTGNFSGSLYANTIGQPIERGFEIGTPGISQIEIQGNLSGILDFDSAIVPDQTFSGSQIVVGGDFLGDSIIRVPEGGLVGQIIFNRDGEEDGIWVPDGANGARVEVGTTTLTNSKYAATAASIGGGAAGLATFQFHRQSCEPTVYPPTYLPQAVLVIQGTLEFDPVTWGFECVYDNPSVYLQFYGPVGINAPTGDPAVLIEFLTESGWVDVSDNFVFEASPDGDEKRIAIHDQFVWDPGSYRISRDPGRLFSGGGVVGSPDVGRFRYYMDVVVNPCEGALLGGFDLNTDNDVTTPGDLPVLLVEQVDLNGDAAINSADVTLLQSAAALFALPAPVSVYYEGPWDDIELP